MNANLQHLHYLSLDPGERTTGWAAFDEHGNDLGIGKVDGELSSFVQWIEGLDPQPREIIYEDYRVNPTINHGFSKVTTVRLIGVIISYAHRHKIPLHSQPNTVLKIGLRYANCYSMYYDSKGRRKKHVDDSISAYAHGVYYLQKHKIRKSRVANR